MAQQDIVNSIITTAQEGLSSAVARQMDRISEGEIEPVEVDNPFRKGKIVRRDRILPNAVIERGLHKDSAFMKALEEGLTEVGYNAIFQLFCAADGEAHIEGEPFKFASVDGVTVRDELHGQFFAKRPS